MSSPATPAANTAVNAVIGQLSGDGKAYAKNILNTALDNIIATPQAETVVAQGGLIQLQALFNLPGLQSEVILQMAQDAKSWLSAI